MGTADPRKEPSAPLTKAPNPSSVFLTFDFRVAPLSQFQKIMGYESREQMTSELLDLKTACLVMPSNKTSSKSAITAPMTVLVSFKEVRPDDLCLGGTDLHWLSLDEALDPSVNVHAGVVALFCKKEGGSEARALLQTHWAGDDSHVEISLPWRLRKMGSWKGDHASMHAQVAGLLLGTKGVTAPLDPRRSS